MKSLIIAALLIGQQPAADPSPFDRPMSELRGGDEVTPLDRLSMNQLMRLGGLSEARRREMKCAGLVQWKDARTMPALALDEGPRKIFADAVTAAIANDAEIPVDIVRDIVAGFASEPDYRKEKGDWSAYQVEIDRDCAPMVAKARAGTLELAPLAQTALVNPMLAQCHARYVVAAERTKDQQEAAGLRKTAADARRLALDGKADAALMAANKALDDAVVSARSEPVTDGEGAMMRLVMCIPAIKAADEGNAE